jgi:enoyl-CoA hydratase
MIRLHYSSTGPNSVATLSMGRRPVNAIDPAFVTAMMSALDDVSARSPTLLVFRSTEKAFSAGADLALIKRYFEETNGTADMVAYVKTLHVLFDRIEKLPCVTLACIKGPALGGGLELALSCDLRIVSSSAMMGLPEARVGMIPGAGGTQRLTRLCGPGIAARLILSADIVDGTEAHRIGLAQWVVDDGAFDPAVNALCGRISGLSPPALVASKDCLRDYFDPTVDGFARELEKPAALMATLEARERIAAFFKPKT